MTVSSGSIHVQCMAEVGRLESCKAEVMRRLIKDKWSDVEAVCAASHLVTPAIPAMYDAAVSNDRVQNSGQVLFSWSLLNRVHIFVLGKNMVQRACTGFVT